MKAVSKSLRAITQISLMILIMAMVGCSNSGKESTLDNWTAQIEDFLHTEAPFQQVLLFYGTDRKITGESEPDSYFGSQDGKLSLGTSLVSVPYDKKIGLHNENAFWMNSRDEKSSKNYELLDIRPLSSRSIESILAERLSASNEHNVFIFVHGYNTSFIQAAKTTARLAYHMNIPGSAMFFSWPAKGDRLDYLEDEKVSAESDRQLADFLTQIADNNEISRIVLMSHSMGCVPLSRAYTILKSELDNNKLDKFTDLVMVTPDINLTHFNSYLASELSSGPAAVTVFTSDRDRKLMTSHDERFGVRLGDPLTGNRPQGIRFINASKKDTSLTGNPYWVKDGSVLEDVERIIHTTP